MFKFAKTTLALASFALLAAASQANLLVNGNFEADAYPNGTYKDLPSSTGSLTGWKIDGDVAGIGVGYLGATSQEIDLSGATDVIGSGIEQTFATTAGTKYNLNLDVYTNGTQGGVKVLVNNVQLATGLMGTGRTPYAYSFTATSAQTTLALLATGTPIAHVDNVSVQAVPEPMSVGALAIGGLGLMRRRRKA